MTIFRDVRFSWLWAIIRVYVGYQWLEAGLHKVSDPKWVATGEAIKGSWAKSATIPAAPARPAITYDWYRAFISGLLNSNSHTWFGPLIAYGELLVGIALIVGIATTVAVFAAAFMNLNFMLNGSSSTNPVLYTLAILLLVAGANAYYWGVDRLLLPKIFPGRAATAGAAVK